jgi:hypothetical protein
LFLSFLKGAANVLEAVPLPKHFQIKLDRLNFACPTFAVLPGIYNCETPEYGVDY